MHYEICSAYCSNAEQQQYLTYGIQADGCRIDDISTCRQTVQRLESLLNRNQVLPEHLRDIVDDFLAE